VRKVVKGSKKAKDAGSYVYIGYNKAGEPVYVGITKDVAKRQAQHGPRFNIQEIPGLGRISTNQARAIETAIIERSRSLGLGFENMRRSIGTNNPLYNELMPSGFQWVDNNMPWLR
jgi:hypothetical protein